MQPAQADHIRKLIEQSPVLTPQERTEWLDVLVLMNDKQAAELQEILDTNPPPLPTPKPPPVVPIPHNLPIHTGGSLPPTLTHISNLPANLAVNAAWPKAKPAAKAPAPDMHAWRKQLDKQVQEKELPAPAVPQRVTNPGIAFKLTEPAKPTAPEHRPASNALPTKHTAPAKRIPLHLENLADTAKLTLDAIRYADPADLAVRLQQLARMEGYFNLLSYLEDSALYKMYIATGKKILSTNGEFPATTGAADSLTKTEFEQFADILRKIQVN
jgi:hypothetical protein